MKKSSNSKVYCQNCLKSFTDYEDKTKEIKLKERMLECDKYECGKIIMPKLGENTLKFKNFKNKIWAPYVIYAILKVY